MTHPVKYDLAEQRKHRNQVNHDVTTFAFSRMKREILSLVSSSREGYRDFTRLDNIFDEIEQVIQNEGLTRLEVLQDSSLWANRFYPDLVAFWDTCRLEQIKQQKIFNAEKGIG